jgi:hypothetical protein
MTRRRLITAIALAAALAGCETWVDTADDEPATMTDTLRPLVGRWQGTIRETGTVFYQGRAALDVRITDDARWSGTIGQASASGVARMRHGWLVLSGTATTPDGHQDVIYYELTGDTSRRWGQIASTFSGGDGQGRVEHATVSLRRTS